MHNSLYWEITQCGPLVGVKIFVPESKRKAEAVAVSIDVDN